MEKFINDIKKLLYYPKLSTINRNIPLKTIEEYQLLELINKLLVRHEYNLYFYIQTIKIGNDTLTINFPSYDGKNIINLDITKINYNNNSNTIVPILINNQHIMCFIINPKKTHVIFYDPFGINNDTCKKIKKIVKKTLLEHNDVFKRFTFVSFNCPIQKYVKDDSNPWFYEMSCGIILSIFIYLYFLLDGDGLLEYLIKFCKSIKKKYINEFKDLLLFCYIALVEKYN
jgi:hypothetical protein